MSAVYEACSIDDGRLMYAVKITHHVKRVKDEFERIQMMGKEKINSPFLSK